MRTNYPLTLLYDARCAVCALEMDHLRDRAQQRGDGRLVFIDISAPGFDPAPFGATLAAMNAEIHGVRPDGSVLRGVPVLRLAYAAVGLGWVLWPTGWAPLRPLFDAGYRVFARYRQSISRVAAPLIQGLRAHRVAQRMKACQGGACEHNNQGRPS
jgi:predicted DCC family thiol-disulfide oxidoreductase YuxK